MKTIDFLTILSRCSRTKINYPTLLFLYYSTTSMRWRGVFFFSPWSLSDHNQDSERVIWCITLGTDFPPPLCHGRVIYFQLGVLFYCEMKM